MHVAMIEHCPHQHQSVQHQIIPKKAAQWRHEVACIAQTKGDTAQIRGHAACGGTPRVVRERLCVAGVAGVARVLRRPSQTELTAILLLPSFPPSFPRHSSDGRQAVRPGLRRTVPLCTEPHVQCRCGGLDWCALYLSVLVLWCCNV